MNAIQMEPEELLLLVPFGLHSWIVRRTIKERICERDEFKPGAKE